ncbi:poly(A) polymerase [Verrucomicrobium sp. GAS474]|uniref:CCA tRNA nucleotidyltransferase n=1 Tax=Verrucomicrobium sp. GAS474 TaxID=1882831 RepID=UPI00087A59B8|nr:CCA tRNA nucleotidyltransferase [Verrucomicrobium sp. GAS474]SDT89838.1 poly(A) polymerase [Verrucomicrobium sp. GAS474]
MSPSPDSAGAPTLPLEAASRAVVGRLQQAGHIAYFAGGCVRDRLLGRVPHDYDVATDAPPEKVQSLFPRTTGLVGKAFGVICVLERGCQVEVATFRQDLDYVDGRRPTGVRFVTAEEDAQRRDFTVNGLFCDPASDPAADRVIDYVGGQADLAKKLIRAIGEPRARFAEDKLRLLRAVRFAVTLGFEIEAKTWEAVREAAGEIAVVSPERIRDELDKIWTGPDPARGLDLLDQSGLLAVVLPELAALHGVEQPPQFHPEGDVFVHTRLMLSGLRNAPLPLALSVLFHDIGKPPTFAVDETGRIRFNGHESVGARMTEKVMKRLRYSNEALEAVVACVANHMAFKDVPNMRLSTLKRFLARPTFETEMELHRLDCTSSHGHLDIYRLLQEKLATLPAESIDPDPLVTGHDLMEATGLTEGRRLGQLVRQIREAQLDGKIASKEEALALAKHLLGNS